MAQFGKDNPPPGRQGSENKYSKAIKDAVMKTCDSYIGEGNVAGLEGYLGLLMHSDPKTFTSLLKSMITKEVNANHDGSIKHIVKSIIECVDAPKDKSPSTDNT